MTRNRASASGATAERSAIRALRLATTALVTMVAAAAAGAQPPVAGVTVSGRIHEAASDTPIPYLTVRQRAARDSAFVAGRLTDSAGAFVFGGIQKGSYVLEARRLGFAPLRQPVFVGQLSAFPDPGVLRMTPATRILSDGVATATPDEVADTLDRKRFCVEDNMAMAGGSVLRSMATLPAVPLTQDGTTELSRGASTTARNAAHATRDADTSVTAAGEVGRGGWMTTRSRQRGVAMVRLQASASGTSGAPYCSRATRAGAPGPPRRTTVSVAYCWSHRSGLAGPPSASTIRGTVLLCPTTSTTASGPALRTAAATAAACAATSGWFATTIGTSPCRLAAGAAVLAVRRNSVTITCVRRASARALSSACARATPAAERSLSRSRLSRSACRTTKTSDEADVAGAASRDADATSRALASAGRAAPCARAIEGVRARPSQRPVARRTERRMAPDDRRNGNGEVIDRTVG